MKVRASHILVKSKEKAEQLINELEKGAEFSALARKQSNCPSKENCGDLGTFGKGKMVPEFKKAAFNLKVDEFTNEPVKTRFGYHVILRTE